MEQVTVKNRKNALRTVLIILTVLWMANVLFASCIGLVSLSQIALNTFTRYHSNIEGLTTQVLYICIQLFECLCPAAIAILLLIAVINYGKKPVLKLFSTYIWAAVIIEVLSWIMWLGFGIISLLIIHGYGFKYFTEWFLRYHAPLFLLFAPVGIIAAIKTSSGKKYGVWLIIFAAVALFVAMYTNIVNLLSDVSYLLSVYNLRPDTFLRHLNFAWISNCIFPIIQSCTNIVSSLLFAAIWTVLGIVGIKKNNREIRVQEHSDIPHTTPDEP